MYALMESADAVNLFKDDSLVASYRFDSAEHAQKIYSEVIKGVLPEEIETFLLDNDVDDLIVDKSLVKSGLRDACKSIKFVEDQRRLRLLREKIKAKDESVRGLSHSMAHKNVNFYTLDPLIAQSYCMLKQIESDIERYDKRAAEIYLNYLPELKIRKRKDESDDEKVEYKQFYDVEVIKKLWKIKENGDMSKKYLWTKDSVGIELSPNDWTNLQRLVDLVELKKKSMDKLLKYLEQQVEIHAPNLNALLGFRLTAELVTLCGSLINLAKCSSSTVQVLGAEKALFRSLKNKTPTPKYGILKNNGLTKSPRIIRSLASKIVLCARIDVFRRTKTDAYGKALRAVLETKVKTNKKVLTDEVLAKVTEQLKKVEVENAGQEEAIGKAGQEKAIGKAGQEKAIGKRSEERKRRRVVDDSLQDMPQKGKKARVSVSLKEGGESKKLTNEEPEDSSKFRKVKHVIGDEEGVLSKEKTITKPAKPASSIKSKEMDKVEQKSEDKSGRKKDKKRSKESDSKLEYATIDPEAKDSRKKRESVAKGGRKKTTTADVKGTEADYEDVEENRTEKSVKSMGKDTTRRKSEKNMSEDTPRRKSEKKMSEDTPRRKSEKNMSEDTPRRKSKLESSSKSGETKNNLATSSRRKSLKKGDSDDIDSSSIPTKKTKSSKTDKNENDVSGVKSSRLSVSMPGKAKAAGTTKIKISKTKKDNCDAPVDEKNAATPEKTAHKDTKVEKENEKRDKSTSSEPRSKRKKRVTGNE
ncbi:hypothetical protein VCUG_01658 [Vavraia culicis subsp. floridensis]|uniref:Nop domain-containing protein n=1 Tax=Vavraia culicis (isolate floridensis) TaxID=948595 RepID=L2GTF1_VAVCU|nr:uncharacterized protein VCUG_01658 [Vavraia culicis subsp. floridensis]ELA46884.1 hypothetical protein VCUG_01658 [Vavraia culicis subsp. floridensis]